MRQALHIFKKDLRGYWYEIAVTLRIAQAAYSILRFSSA
jgi:hypothetical protein